MNGINQQEVSNNSQGTHNGTVGGFTYFKATNGPKSGSMILARKAEFGESFTRAFIRKYFRNEDVQEILENDDQTLIDTVLQIQKSVNEEEKSRIIYL